MDAEKKHLKKVCEIDYNSDCNTCCIRDCPKVRAATAEAIFKALDKIEIIKTEKGLKYYQKLKKKFKEA
jgi:hypothetical protein